jgi:hypothetical protein
MIYSQVWKEEASWIEGASLARLFLMIASVGETTSSNKSFQALLTWALILLRRMQNLMSLDSHGSLKSLAFKDGSNQITTGKIKIKMMVFNPSLSRLSSSLNKKVPD